MSQSHASHPCEDDISLGAEWLASPMLAMGLLDAETGGLCLQCICGEILFSKNNNHVSIDLLCAGLIVECRSRLNVLRSNHISRLSRIYTRLCTRLLPGQQFLVLYHHNMY